MALAVAPNMEVTTINLERRKVDDAVVGDDLVFVPSSVVPHKADETGILPEVVALPPGIPGSQGIEPTVFNINTACHPTQHAVRPVGIINQGFGLAPLVAVYAGGIAYKLARTVFVHQTGRPDRPISAIIMCQK